MVWHYLLVFAGAFAVDVVPFPLPPAFTVMMLLQILFDLNVWLVIALGVLGSIAGRYVLSVYIPHVSGRLFKPAKNEDVQYLGRKLKQKGWKSQALVLVYSLMPLPTTPLFIAGGMARLKPWQIIPAFVVGKIISDTAAVFMGNSAVKTADDLVDGMFSAKSIVGLILKFNIWR
jgi:uncharacterized membrane protein YdjX (TVP38/TMEM64 family)